MNNYGQPNEMHNDVNDTFVDAAYLCRKPGSRPTPKSEANPIPEGHHRAYM
jgi:hypothetical protein